MFRRSQFRRGRPGRQRGLAMIAILTLFALVTSYLVVNGLARTQADVNVERNRRSLQAMQEAKAALIIYAASRAWTTRVSDPLIVNDQPGALPCPASNNLGNDPGNCATASTRIGRLPWKTIRAVDLRDASGEVLWYALSANFRKASGTTVINSDTQGTLSVTGTSPASNVVAIIIAPGAPLSGQNRLVNSVANYLEGSNAGGTDTFVTGQSSETFNDQIVVITQADLMAMVEPAVAARIERDIKPELISYLSSWGRFPFPAKFNDASLVGPGNSATRARDAYAGDATPTTEGLLPLTTLVNSWSGGGISKISGTGTVIPATCATVASGYRCTFDVKNEGDGGISDLRVQMLGNADKAGLGFVYKPTVTDVTKTLNGATNNFISQTYSVGTLTPAGAATITYLGTINLSCPSSTCGTWTVQITFADLITRPIVSSTDPTGGWFIKNEWFRQTYYSVAPDYLPGGSAPFLPLVCVTNCLTVNKLSFITTSNDKIAILIFSGRALSGSRPSSSLSSYLEGENQTPADRIFAHRSGSILSSNDSAIVVAP